MPEMNVGGLSESWLFRYAGDLHWQALCAQCGVSSDELRDAAGARLYPTFLAVRARYLRPLSSVRENDRLVAGVDLGWRARGYAHSRVQLTDGPNRLELEMLTMLAARSSDTGELRASLPVTVGNPHAGRDAVPAPGLVDLAKAARQQVRHHDAFAGSVLGRHSHERPPLGTISYEPSPYADFNGAGLLYFASYVAIVDTAERQVARTLGWAGASVDWALSTSTVRRDIFYYANIALGQKVCSQVMSIERSAELVTTHTRLVREADGLLMADVITAKAIVAR
jgi:probable biosynthetic protein (TIGR04098 family)